MKAQQPIFPIMTSKNHSSHQIHIRSTPSDSLTPGKNLPLVAIISSRAETSVGDWSSFCSFRGRNGMGALGAVRNEAGGRAIGVSVKIAFVSKWNWPGLFDGVNFPETDFFSGFYDQQKGMYQYGDPCPFLCYFFFLKKGSFHLSTDGVWYEPNSVPLYVEGKQSPLRVCVWIWWIIEINKIFISAKRKKMNERVQGLCLG